MTARVQSLRLDLDNHGHFEIILIEQGNLAFRAMVMRPAPHTPIHTWHEQVRSHISAEEAFGWAVRHIDAFCRRISAAVVGIADEIGGDIIDREEQMRILASHSMTPQERVAGVTAEQPAPREPELASPDA